MLIPITRLFEDLKVCNYDRCQNKLCVPFCLNAASYFFPTEIKRKRNGMERSLRKDRENEMCRFERIPSKYRMIWLDI